MWVPGPAFLLAVWVAACGPGGRTLPAPEPTACVVLDDEPAPLALFALAQAVDLAVAPVPRTASERLLFRQLYETLVTIDCDGRVQPGLAVSWSTEQDGRVWRFRSPRGREILG